MTKLEKIGLYFSSFASLLSILKYFGISFSKNYFDGMPSFLNIIFLWIYDNIILFKVNIWLLILIIFGLYKFNQYRTKKKNITNKPKQKTLIEIFNEFNDNTKHIFMYIMYCQDSNKECYINNLTHIMKSKHNMGNLETSHILDTLRNKNIIKVKHNVLHPDMYTFTRYGRNIAIEIMKKSKKNSGSILHGK